MVNVEHLIPAHRIMKLAVKAVGGAKVLAQEVGVSQSLIERQGLPPSGEDNLFNGTRTDMERIEAVMLALHNSNNSELIHYITDFFHETERQCYAERDLRIIETVQAEQEQGSALAKIARVLHQIVGIFFF